MKLKHIFPARHGESVGNIENVFTPRSSITLCRSRRMDVNNPHHVSAMSNARLHEFHTNAEIDHFSTIHPLHTVGCVRMA